MFFLWLILGLFAITILISILLIMSTIKLKIENFCFTLPKSELANRNFSNSNYLNNELQNKGQPNNELLNSEFKIIFELYLFGWVKVLSINIDKTKMERQKILDEFSKVEKKLRKNQNSFDLKFFDVLKNLIKKISLEMIDLEVYLGTEDASLTAISVGVTSGVIGYLLGVIENNKNQFKKKIRLRKIREKSKIKNNIRRNFKVIPIYQNRNLLKIDFDGIFAIKMRDIISIIYNLLKKESVKKNGRTSDRRSYAYSNE